jgi:hypothetical protein
MSQSIAPLDIAMMRATASTVLAIGGLPRFNYLQDTLLLVRGHLNLLSSEVERQAKTLPDEHGTRTSVLASVASVRRLLDSGPGCGLVSATQHAKALARDLRTLCDHYETLTARHPPEQPV